MIDAKVEIEKLGFIALPPTLSGELGEKPQPETLFLAIQSIEKAL